jgi:hypothetical protein
MDSLFEQAAWTVPMLWSGKESVTETVQHEWADRLSLAASAAKILNARPAYTKSIPNLLQALNNH